MTVKVREVSSAVPIQLEVIAQSRHRAIAQFFIDEIAVHQVKGEIVAMTAEDRPKRRSILVLPTEIWFRMLIRTTTHRKFQKYIYE